MITFVQFGIIMAAINATIEGAKRITWSVNPISLCLSVMNLIAEIIIQVFIVYKFPLLFVSYVVVTDPLFQTIVKKYIYKIYKKYLIKLQVTNQ
jgi:hypothetical protein